MSEESREDQAEILALSAAGALAGGVAAELAMPLREVREELAFIVESLDQHFATAKGPDPYPWESLKALRERVAQAYLTSRKVARLVGELEQAINSYGQRQEVADVNSLVEIAISLSRHRISADTEFFVDFGKVPGIRATAGSLILLLSRLIAVAADSAHGVQGAAVSVKTRLEEGGDEIAIYVADSGAGQPVLAERAVVLGEHIAETLGGSFAGRSETGKGSVFELRIPVRR